MFWSIFFGGGSSGPARPEPEAPASLRRRSLQAARRSVSRATSAERGSSGLES